jgi:NADPH:quinone reductase-like Zn-dependent oxidoreductase
VQFSEYATSDVLRIVDLPGGLGSDVAGAVDQVGEGVTAFSAGDEALGGLHHCSRGACHRHRERTQP